MDVSPDGASPQRELIRFIETCPGFVCSFGREALQKGTLIIETLPALASTEVLVQNELDSEEPALLEQRRIISSSLERLSTTERGAIILIEEQPHLNHTEGYTRTWRMFAELFAAGRARAFGADSFKDLLEEGHFKAFDYAFNQDMREGLRLFMDDFSSGNGFTLDGETQQFFAMNALYPMEPELFPRYAPVTIYLINPHSDVSTVKRSHPAQSAAIATRMLDQSTVPYVGQVPYIIPNDVRHASREFLELANYVVMLCRCFSDHVQGNPIQLASLVNRGLRREHLEVQVPSADQDNGLTIDHVVDFLVDAELARPGFRVAFDQAMKDVEGT